jgi:hypothetical protein
MTFIRVFCLFRIVYQLPCSSFLSRLVDCKSYRDQISVFNKHLVMTSDQMQTAASSGDVYFPWSHSTPFEEQMISILWFEDLRLSSLYIHMAFDLDLRF